MSDSEDQQDPDENDPEAEEKEAQLREQEFAAAKALVERLRARSHQTRPSNLRVSFNHPPSESSGLQKYKSEQEELTLAAIKSRRKSLTVTLRKRVANAAIVFVTAQLLSSNIFFGAYVFANLHNLDSTVLIAWLSATVIEVIGILGIVTISLFPNKNNKRKAEV